jgi:hypothetical protein
MEEEVARLIEPAAAQERQVTSYSAPSDRWPELPEAPSADYFDDVMAAWRDLSHRQRLVREQAGSLWSE